MGKDQKKMSRFGLVGENISYSFSQQYFSKKFKSLKLEGHEYQNFDIATIDDFPGIVSKVKGLKGMNVTIPYKEAVLPYLDEIDDEARIIGAVNTIRITKECKLKGYNTDVYGFEESLRPFLKKHHKKALILGTGGASKAINFVLDKIGIDALFVSRSPNKEEISYEQLSKSIIETHTILINCTPLGTYPAVDESPSIPYQYLTSKHLLYD